MTTYPFDAPDQPDLPIAGSQHRYPVLRIFCIGRNYAAHAAEMGNAVDTVAPFFFTKSAHALLQSGDVMAYPQGTQDLHHEIELVVAIGASVGLENPPADEVEIFGYAVGLDMTRRDLQAAAKDGRKPWDAAKDFEQSAIIGPITPAIDCLLDAARIRLDVNGAVRQDAPLADMIHDVTRIVAHLSGLYHLRAGDLIMTGTPAGVAAVVRGDVLTGSIDGLETVTTTIG
ncbi:fumarylpyruvate hydrolase [Loktanella fryxellensis]|uniref:Fumarylpyruvate hydrolase n=1 Tax=Loktanella fryxellensis TaxID=245187 RepID=A0A1H8BS92_9RHOB|nr:fumarylacetoacetate hydrolase family protein [Loktanella fryxellensis]SEM84747.1 fumarylpyruvate hydrolase [Loktanella fryxellensis]